MERDITSIKPFKTVKAHQISIISISLLKDGRLASCSIDNTINILNMNNNFHCDMTLIGHKKPVYFVIQLDSGDLVSCSSDCSLKIWSITQTEYKCLFTIEKAHEEGINKIVLLSHSRIASCAQDNYLIKIWDMTPPYREKTKIPIKILGDFKEDDAMRMAISLLYIKEKDILVSGGFDYILRIYNMKSYQCINTINDIECYNPNSIYQIDKERIIIGGRDYITIVNIDKYVIENKISSQLCAVCSFVQLSDKKTVLCGCNGHYYVPKDSYIKEIKKEENFNLYELMIKRCINCFITTDENTFLSASDDGNIIVWKY